MLVIFHQILDLNKYNFIDGDVIFIPKNSNVINVLGEVLNPTAFEYSKNLSINQAIESAGGFQQFADTKRVYVIKSNGLVQKVNRNIFLGNTGLQQVILSLFREK